MRIIAGTYRSRKLITLDSYHTRPTLDKVKEAVFSSIGSKIQDASFLDLFAGSGAIGLEAYSRGASPVYLNDMNNEAFAIINANIEALEALVISSQLEYRDCIERLKSAAIKIDVIYLDPPFETVDYHQLLNEVACSGLLHEKSLVVLEHDQKFSPNTIYGKIAIYKQAKYGRICITYFKEIEND